MLQRTQPTGSNASMSPAASPNPPRSRSAAGIVTGRLHSSQSRRPSRWATTHSTPEAIRNGSIPMSVSRAGAIGASLVCRVESTRCPVSADWIAICAVSLSRISPTISTSGSERIIERSPAANDSPVFGLTWICLTPSSSYSTGSSIAISVRSGVLTSVSAA